MTEATATQLHRLWKAIDDRRASVQDRIDAATLAGELRDLESIPRVTQLLDDPEEMVRYFALQALVLDLGQKGPLVRDTCWRLTESDESDDVRAMAITCLGSVLFASRDRAAWDRFSRILKATDKSPAVRSAAYSGLFKLAGRPPAEWPGVTGSRSFDPIDIDWSRLSELEASLEGH